MVLTALLTGVRESELFGLFWEDFDWDHDVVRVRRQLFWRFGRYQERKEGSPGYIFVKPKSHYAIREIDLSPILKKELLKRYLRDSKHGLVFRTKKHTPFIPNNVYKRKFKPALQKAGIEGNVRFHDLRHTFGALKIEQGENPYYIQRQMGHSSIQVTFDIYGHLLESRNPALADLLNDFVMAECLYKILNCSIRLEKLATVASQALTQTALQKFLRAIRYSLDGGRFWPFIGEQNSLK